MERDVLETGKKKHNDPSELDMSRVWVGWTTGPEHH